MAELRHDAHLPKTVSKRRAPRLPERPNRLGGALREARLDKGLELRDLAEITNIRPSHLEALETGHYGGLPEEVYSKNFVRLYAQAVGLDPARMLLLYAQERRSAAPAAREPVTGLELPPDDTSPFDHPWLRRLLRLLWTLLLVGGVVAGALWAFNGLLFQAGRPSTGAASTETVAPEVIQTAPAAPIADGPIGDEPVVEEPFVNASTPAVPGPLILLSLRTTPPGGEVSIDGYRVGRSPIVDAPVRAGRRTVRVERGGYRAFERAFDLSRDRRLNIELTPTQGPRAGAATGAQQPDARQNSTATEAQAAGTNQITVSVTAAAWLEVYRGTNRGGGERLVYETAQPGDTFTFDAPVYIFSGNAGGVSVAQGGAAAVLGAPGAVVGEAY
ncbi:MAG: hypothetical protein AVDCRST_MAG86-2812 [uncultured Truepera sp.]|uniref:HTH cro/C1-type domain-containing protein n=1 Tax=uncultured Truepera sp. TaxID=543023 RepID=A0A6J4VND9_9DEIN|nr:MAG: hypothetical protein AVDCRST_MAG86-2812 [uncultured Truepera sp.]